MAEVATQSGGGLFSPEALLMLSIFGVLDIIDFFLGSILVVDIIAILVYSAWTYFRGQAKKASETQAQIETARKTREEKRQQFGEKKKVRQASLAKRGKWLRKVLFILEWIPIVGMIPGWTLMVYSELKD